jgi:phosphoribosylamine--glycine ligase
MQDDALVATGGRVLNVTAVGATVSEARDRAYAAIDEIRWDNGFCRKDIGWRAVAREQQAG